MDVLARIDDNHHSALQHCTVYNTMFRDINAMTSQTIPTQETKRGNLNPLSGFHAFGGRRVSCSPIKTTVG